MSNNVAVALIALSMISAFVFCVVGVVLAEEAFVERNWGKLRLVHWDIGFEWGIVLGDVVVIEVINAFQFGLGWYTSIRTLLGADAIREGYKLEKLLKVLDITILPPEKPKKRSKKGK